MGYHCFTKVGSLWATLTAVFSLASDSSYSLVLFIFLALFCYWVLALRPFKESPFALLLLATGPVDELIFLGAILFLSRALFSGRAYIPRTSYGYMFLMFVLVVGMSAMLSWVTIEFRPLQTLFWMITFLAPWLIIFLRFRLPVDVQAIARYAVFLLVLGWLPILAQIPKSLRAGTPDVIVGTWGDADIVGFWEVALAVSAVMYYLDTRYVRLRRIIFLVISGISMALLASGKTYSGSVGLGVAFALLASPKSFLKLFIARPRGWIVVAIMVAVLGIVAQKLAQYRDVVLAWLDYQLEHSQKIVFLHRVFHMGEYGYPYHELLGVGPGMLGSRAANSVSGDVLVKEHQHMPSFLVHAPAPEARIMAGSFDEELLERIKWMSATLVLPFSGVGAVKGELGWIGLLLWYAAVVARFWPRWRRQPPTRELGVVYWMWLAAGFAVPILSLFDTAWEMPKIVVFLGAISLAVRI